MLLKKIITILTLISFFIYLAGCYSKQWMPREEFELSHSEYTIVKVVTVDGEVIKFMTSPKRTITSPDGVRFQIKLKDWKKPALNDDRIEGFMIDETFKVILLSQVKTVYVKKFSPDLTAVAIAIPVGLIALVAYEYSHMQIP